MKPLFRILLPLGALLFFSKCQLNSDDKVTVLDSGWQVARQRYSPEAIPPNTGWQAIPSVLHPSSAEPEEEVWFRTTLPATREGSRYLLVGLTNPCEIFTSGQRILTFGTMTMPPRWPGIGYFIEPLPAQAQQLDIRCLPATPQLRLLEPVVGSYRAIIRDQIPDVLLRVSLSLFYLGLGLTIMALYLSLKKLRQDIFYFHIGLFFILAGTFNLSSGNSLLGTIWHAPLLTAFVAHLTAFFLPLPLLFMVKHLIGEKSAKWLYPLAALHLALLVISLVAPVLSSLSLESFAQPFRVLFLVTLITIPLAILSNLDQRKPDLIIFFVGAMIGIATAIFDLVETFLYRQAQPVAHLYGLIFFVGSLLVIIVRRFLAIVERQEQHSRELEQSVRERTHKLNATIKEMQSELNTARKFQQKMLPDLYELQNLPVRTAARFLPMNAVGGDIYFIAPLPNGRIRYFIADAAGHGIEAAIVTIAIKGEFEANSPISQEPQKMLELLNSKFVAKYRSLNTFFSAAVCDIDPQENKIIFSSAGHPAQFLNHKGQLITLGHTGPLIGIMEQVSYQQKVYSFEPGDSLLLFTDGILEQTKFENSMRYEFGEHRLAEILLAMTGSDATDIADIIETELIRYTEESPQDDDITLICVSYG